MSEPTFLETKQRKKEKNIELNKLAACAIAGGN
jgi:hypothetical protein